MTNSSSWLTICGKERSDIQELAISRVSEKIKSSEFKAKDIEYVSTLWRPLTSTGLTISDSKLEKLRSLCGLWNVQPGAVKIESHRKYIGPIIVKAKLCLFPIVKVLLRDSYNQQRDFNAKAITLLTELSDEVERLKIEQGSV